MQLGLADPYMCCPDDTHWADVPYVPVAGGHSAFVLIAREHVAALAAALERDDIYLTTVANVGFAYERRVACAGSIELDTLLKRMADVGVRDVRHFSFGDRLGMEQGESGAVLYNYMRNYGQVAHHLVAFLTYSAGCLT